MDVFESKYPWAQAVFIFDRAPCHVAKFSDAPNVHRMNRHAGGNQSVIHDTVFNGKPFSFLTKDGVAKGLIKLNVNDEWIG